MLLGLYLVLVIALPLALGSLVVFNGLPRTRLCPRCATQTIRLRSRRHRLASRALPADELHSRWCPSCAWAGTARIARQVPPKVRVRSAPAGVVEEARGGLEIRRVELDDGSWRVHLECWAEEDGWHGRLRFVAPGGRAWTDGRAPLTGRSAVQVLSQVLALSDSALVGRIRKATR